jgi:Zn-dependent peptidase ImmA (M78 family)/transcriptional regulator with XRE-family HTH domain
VNRLRAYREIEGINQQELGDILGLSPQMVSAIEAGRRTFSGDLETIGYAARRMSLPDMSEPLHRTRASTTVAVKNRAKELMRLAGEIFVELRDRTERAPQLRLDRRVGPMSIAELEEFAVEVRCGLDHEENGPIQNLTAAVERAGVCLVPITGLSVPPRPGVGSIDGLSAWVNGVPVIGLSPHAPGDRFRWSLGHELLHLLVHVQKTDSTELEANRFAGALLVPQAEFDAAMPDRPQLRDFIAMKSAWGMSVAALVYRAHDLGYIDDSRYRALQIQMAKWRKSEPGEFAPAYGQLFARLVQANGGPGAVARDLGVNVRHLEERLNWNRLRAA